MSDEPQVSPRPKWQRGSKTQVTWSVDPTLLARIDEAAKRRFMSRAALLTTWATEALAREAKEMRG